jgi:hypothetical protein
MLWNKPKIRLERKAVTNTILNLAVKEVPAYEGIGGRPLAEVKHCGEQHGCKKS